jgi:protein-tyrosine phosphatase
MISSVDRWATRARALAHQLKHLPSRVLHPLRRAAGLRRLRKAGLPRSILFVCHGNICRSPYAEHAFSILLPPVLREYMDVRSAGFTGAGRPTPQNGLTIAAGRGIDLQEHRSRPLSRELVQASDLIVVMEARQGRDLRAWFDAPPARIVVLGDLDPEPIETRTVRDPIFQDRDVFDTTYARIDRCIAELVRVITGEHPTDAAQRNGAPAPSRPARLASSGN